MASVRLKSYDGEVHDLPDVCMKCGAPSAVRKNKTFSWCPGFTPKRCDVEVPLCERHKNHWLMRKLLVLLSMLGVYALGVVPVIAAFAADPRPNDPFAIACLVGWVVLLLGWFILAIVVQVTTIRTTEITDTSIRLVSVSEEFAAAYKEKMPDVRGLLDRAARERWNDGERRADKKDEKTPPPGPATWDIKAKRTLTLVEELMAESSGVLSKAQAFQTMGMGETAQTLWVSAASLQERIAPLLDADGETLEAAVYRMSAASCYEKAGDLSRAVNLYQAALAGPLREVTRKEVEGMLEVCLTRLKAASSGRKARRVASAS